MGSLYQLFEDMVKRLAKAGQAILDSLTANGCHVIHMTLGLCGELKEIRTAILSGDRNNLVEELGDYEFYLQGICQSIDAAQTFQIDDELEPHLTLDKFFDDLVNSTGIMTDTVKRIHVMNKPGWGDEKVYEAVIRVRETLDRFYRANSWDITLEEVIEGNRVKLETGAKPRYQGTYSDDAANARADKDGKGPDEE